MFDIRIKQVEKKCPELESIAKQIATEAADLESVAGVLASIKGMGDYTGVIKKQIEKMDEERRNLYHLSQGLNKVLQQYNRCENDIMDECEACRITYTGRDIGMVTFSSAGIGGTRIAWSNRSDR